MTTPSDCRAPLRPIAYAAIPADGDWRISEQVRRRFRLTDFTHAIPAHDPATGSLTLDLICTPAAPPRPALPLQQVQEGLKVRLSLRLGPSLPPGGTPRYVVVPGERPDSMTLVPSRTGEERSMLNITRDGRLKFSSGAARQHDLAAASHMLLRFAPRSQQIALAPIRDPRAFGAAALDHCRGRYHIVAKRFLTHFDIAFSQGGLYPLHQDVHSGWLIADLTCPLHGGQQSEEETIAPNPISAPSEFVLFGYSKNNGGLCVAITREGRIAFYDDVRRLCCLEEYSHVRLDFEPETGQVTVHLVREAEPTLWTAALRMRRAGADIYAAAFLRSCGINFEERRIFPVTCHPDRHTLTFNLDEGRRGHQKKTGRKNEVKHHSPRTSPGTGTLARPAAQTVVRVTEP